MKKLWTVFEFELMSYVKNKSFMITTILMAVIALGVMFLPRVIDMSEMLGTESTKKEEASKDDKDDVTKLGIVDKSGYFTEVSVLEETFSEAMEEDVQFIVKDDKKDLKKAVEKEEIEAGFVVIDDMNYEYYVFNKDITDMNKEVFNQVLGAVHKQVYCMEHGLDYATFAAEYEAPVEFKEEILGKDAADNFFYCYALVIIIFMLIIMYGVMIATSVTTEKSNRSIEVLVTSIDSKYLLFGKVFAGAFAVIIQVGLILGAALIGYSANQDVWGNKLDALLDIPADVLWTFAVFGIGGFLFYAFLYGAMGALVSKTEDINKTAGTLQMIIMIVYFAVMFQLQNADGIIMKVCSFLPISSYSAMFIRIAMGTVATWEVIVSALILFVSTILVGWLAAKIYRMGTLRYGNPIKLTNALKDMRNID